MGWHPSARWQSCGLRHGSGEATREGRIEQRLMLAKANCCPCKSVCQTESLGMIFRYRGGFFQLHANKTPFEVDQRVRVDLHGARSRMHEGGEPAPTIGCKRKITASLGGARDLHQFNGRLSTYRVETVAHKRRASVRHARLPSASTFAWC